jgi:hypothetical protein
MKKESQLCEYNPICEYNPMYLKELKKYEETTTQLLLNSEIRNIEFNNLNKIFENKGLNDE